MKLSKEEKVRQVVMGAGVGLGITTANPLLLLLLFFGHIYYDLRNPSFDSPNYIDRSITLKPWDKGF